MSSTNEFENLLYRPDGGAAEKSHNEENHIETKVSSKHTILNFLQGERKQPNTDPDSKTGKNRRSPIFRYSSDFRYCSCSSKGIWIRKVICSL